MFPSTDELLQTTVQLDMDCLTCICVIGAIQLATRHPKFTGPSRAIAEKYARQLQQCVEEKLPATGAVLQMGWNPEFDI